jgi:tRNA (guanine37-N1)-methyltransferase
MRIEVVTLFPEFVSDAVGFGVLGRAIQRGHVTVKAYGGGPGMVLKIEPTRSSIRAAKARLPRGARAIYLAADGERFTQAKAAELARLPGLMLLAGRYEGVDERLIETEIDESISIGDYVLSGGELPSLVLVDAVVRLLPGVLGDDESAQQDSFSAGLLDWPHYTRPEVFEGRGVPQVLASGNHAAIRRWRMKQSLGRTWLRRRDLIESIALTSEQRGLLDEFLAEQRAGEAPSDF